MKLSSLGALEISVTPTATNPEIMSVDIIAAARKDGVSMQTNKDETVDQFVMRLKSMLRSLLNAETREGVTVPADDGKPLTWEEQKAALKNKGQK